jgi:hypothetical protein
VLIRVINFAKTYAGRLPAAAEPLMADVNACMDELTHLRILQVQGAGTVRSAAAMRRGLARELRQALVDLAQTGRVLARKHRSGLGAQLRLGKKMGYSTLEATAAAFIQVLTPLKEVYIARGFAPEFLAELQRMSDDLRTSLETKFAGVNERVAATGGLTEAAANAVEIVQDLDAILSPRLRKADSALHAVWKRTIRIRRDAQPARLPRKDEQERVDVLASAAEVPSAEGDAKSSAEVRATAHDAPAVNLETYSLPQCRSSVSAITDGVSATAMPADLSASILPWAVPLPPLTIAPA